MRLLLDSHVFLWWKASDPRLPPAVKQIITEAEAVYVSAASAWELGLKASLGKLRLPESVEEGVQRAGFTELKVGVHHTRISAALPPHHHDPFDRMLVAQAIHEHLTLVTHDSKLSPYPARLLLIP